VIEVLIQFAGTQLSEYSMGFGVQPFYASEPRESVVKTSPKNLDVQVHA